MSVNCINLPNAWKRLYGVMGRGGVTVHCPLSFFIKVTQMLSYYLKHRGVGGYQRFLLSGMADRDGNGGRLHLLHVGPFFPPLCAGGNWLIVTEKMKGVLENSPFTEVTFRPVIKEHIVRWEWKQLSDADDLWGDPEDFLLSAPHDESCSNEIGDLFELRMPVACRVKKTWSNDALTQFALSSRSAPQHDLFFARHPGGNVPMCSQKFCDYVESLDEVGRWIQFLPAKIEVIDG